MKKTNCMLAVILNSTTHYSNDPFLSNRQKAHLNLFDVEIKELEFAPDLLQIKCYLGCERPISELFMNSVFNKLTCLTAAFSFKD